jgi:hypothetical protein
LISLAGELELNGEVVALTHRLPHIEAAFRSRWTQ